MVEVAGYPQPCDDPHDRCEDCGARFGLIEYGELVPFEQMSAWRRLQGLGSTAMFGEDPPRTPTGHLGAVTDSNP